MITLGLDQSEDPDEVSICLLTHKIDPVFQVLNNVVHVLHLSGEIEFKHETREEHIFKLYPACLVAIL